MEHASKGNDLPADSTPRHRDGTAMIELGLQLLHASLHLLDASLQLHDQLHTSQVHALVLRERLDLAQTLDVCTGIPASVALRSLWTHQALALIDPERLGMNPRQL